MTINADTLRRLIATWREAAEFEAVELSNGQRAQTLDQCADELEKEITHGDPNPARSEETGCPETADAPKAGAAATDGAPGE